MRAVLTDVDTNVVTPSSKKSPVATKSPAKVLPKAPRGFRRGLSRSLDSRDQGCPVTKVDFNAFRTGPTQVAPPVVLPVTSPSEGLLLVCSFLTFLFSAILNRRLVCELLVLLKSSCPLLHDIDFA